MLSRYRWNARLASSSILIAVAVTMLACQAQMEGPGTTAGASSEPKAGGIAVFANREDPNSWDPLFASGISTVYVASGIQGSGNLVRNCRDDVYKVCPGLAESWELNRELSQYTLKIRDNVFWHDGTPFTAQDFKWWLELWYNGYKFGDKVRPPASTKASWGDLKQVDVLEGNRIRITLGRPSPTFLDQISDPVQVIALPRHLMQARIEAGEVLLSPSDVGNIGLGPFTFALHEKGSLIKLRRFDKFWEKDEKGRQLPYLDGFDFPIIGNVDTMLAAFRTGRLDGGARGGGFSMLPGQVEALKRDLGDKVWFAEIAGQRWFLNFNVLKAGPQQDVRVRRAMSHWIDKRTGNQAVMGGQGVIHPLMDPRSPWPNPDWQTWPGFSEGARDKDKAEAKRLMAEAGYPNGVSLTHLCRRTWATLCEWLHGDLAGLRAELSTDLKDDATWVQWSRSSTDWHTQILRISRRFPEATESSLTRFSITNGAVIKHEDPKIPEFFERLSRARSLEERVQITRELERYVLLDQVYAIPLFDEVTMYPYRSHVKGLAVPPEGENHYLDFATVWLDK